MGRALLLTCLILSGSPAWAQTATGEGGPAHPSGSAPRASSTGVSAQPHYLLQIEAPAGLADALRSRTLLGRWQSDPEFTPEQLPLFVERAHEEAVAVAQAAGFFSARVQVTMVPGASPPGLPTVKLVLEPGARTTVAGFELTLSGEVHDSPLARQLRERWPLPAGSFFRTDDWELGKRGLIDALQAAGYLRARIAESRARVDPELTSALLALSIDSGPRLGFGALVVRGLQHYPRSIVDDLRRFREGDPYSLDAVLRFQQRLRGAGQFLSATVLPDRAALETDETLTRVPLIVDLAERPRQSVTTGLGYSTDQGLRALLGYEHRSLLGKGWVLESGVLLDGLRSRAFGTVRTPQDGSGHYWQAGLRSERLDTLGEATRTQTAYAGRGRRDEAIESFVSLQYQLESSVLDLGEGALVRDRRSALTLGWAWSLRRLDSRIDPRDGYSLSTQVSASLKGLGSDRSFARFYGRAMRFWPMTDQRWLPDGVLIGLAEAGWVLANEREDIPSQNLFRAGGAQSVRGYRYLGLGLSQGDAIVGGRVMALGSLEYQRRITGDWWGAAFVDVGNVVDTFRQWRPAVGYGLGARWRSPIGPINADLAYGERDQRLRLHFSVGYSF